MVCGSHADFGGAIGSENVIRGVMVCYQTISKAEGKSVITFYFKQGWSF